MVPLALSPVEYVQRDIDHFYDTGYDETLTSDPAIVSATQLLSGY